MTYALISKLGKAIPKSCFSIFHFLVAYLLVVDRNPQPLLIVFRCADAFRFVAMSPQRSPSGCRRVQQIIRSDMGGSVCKVGFNFREHSTQQGGVV